MSQLLCSLFFLLSFLSIFIQSNGEYPCPSNECNGVEIKYPFWKKNKTTSEQFCGYPGFGLNCSNSDQDPILNLPTDPYFVTNINYENNTLNLVDIDVVDIECPRVRHNFSVETLPLYQSPSDLNLTFYFNCSSPPLLPATPITCLATNENQSYVVEVTNKADPFDTWYNFCEDKVVVAVKNNDISRNANGLISDQFSNALAEGFMLDWKTLNSCGKCEASNGRCGFNNTAQQFLCFCEDGSTKRSNRYCKEAQGAQLRSCNHIGVPVKKIKPEKSFENVLGQLRDLFQRSFGVHYYIDRKNDGLCWRDTNLSKSNTCLYKNGVRSPYAGKNKHLGLKLGIASGTAGASLLISILIFYISYRRGSTGQNSSLFSRNAPSYPKDVEAFLRQYGSSTPKIFRYSTIKKMTNSFNDELGKGGYGTVYKGCLSDGRVVAVKVLNATKGNGEEFLNEIASIGRTSHVNVVKLLGFCYEGKKRALIYDYMPNGSLEKFIYGKLPSVEGQHLGWEKLYSIAIGIARGLEYLHRGCNTRILHFDIKPHNILLDEDFCPKISDFGLAKLYNEKESFVSSIMQARGTIGYIAPEVFSRNFGQVSHKSDVYSYGMMILEMVGGRKNVHAGADHTSQIYYPRWLYKRIAFSEELCFGSEMSEEESEIARKMVIVGLWCIQTNPMERPYISKVIEMLEGQIASLEMPPKPYLCSPPSSPSNFHSKPLFSSNSITGSDTSPVED